MPFTAAKLGAVQGSVIVGIGGWRGARSSRPWSSACADASQRDSREACIGRLAPDIAVWNDSDGVPLALVFAQEHGDGLEAPGAIRSRLAAPGEGPSRCFAVSGSSPPRACSWKCQQRNRAFFSQGRAGPSGLL